MFDLRLYFNHPFLQHLSWMIGLERVGKRCKATLNLETWIHKAKKFVCSPHICAAPRHPVNLTLSPTVVEIVRYHLFYLLTELRCGQVLCLLDGWGVSEIPVCENPLKIQMVSLTKYEEVRNPKAWPGLSFNGDHYTIKLKAEKMFYYLYKQIQQKH